MTDHGPQFLIAPEPEPGEEESLATGPESSRNRLRRRLGLGAVVLAGGLLLARALDTHDGTRTASTAQDTTRPPAHSSSKPDATIVPNQLRAERELAEQQRAAQQRALAAAHCPSASSCVVSGALPQGFLDAVRDDLGTASPSSQIEVTDPADGTVRYRQLVADGAAGMQITLTATLTSEIADGSVVGDVNGGNVRVHAVVAGDDGTRYRVELALDGPSDEVPPFQVLQALVTDTRLL